MSENLAPLAPFKMPLRGSDMALFLEPKGSTSRLRLSESWLEQCQGCHLPHAPVMAPFIEGSGPIGLGMGWGG